MPDKRADKYNPHSLRLLSYSAFDSGSAQMTHGLAAGTAVQARDAGVSEFFDQYAEWVIKICYR